MTTAADRGVHCPGPDVVPRGRVPVLGLALALLALVMTATPVWAGVLFNATTDRLTAATFTVPTTGTLCFTTRGART